MSSNRRRTIFKIGILMLLLITAVAICYHQVWSPKEPSIREISQMCGLKFPPNATLVHSYLTGGFGMQLFARIEMDRSDVDHWVTRTIKSMERSEISNKERIERIPREEHHWWRPGQPHKFISMIVRPDYEPESHILIDMDDGHKSTVYLYRSR